MNKKPQYFIQNKEKPADPNRKPINWFKWMRNFFLFLVISIILGYGALQFKGVYDKASKNWEEIMFAYEKPAIVKTIREDYEKKNKKLEQSFLLREKSPEDQLVDAVVKKLEQAEDLKSSDLPTQRQNLLR